MAPHWLPDLQRAEGREFQPPAAWILKKCLDHGRKWKAKTVAFLRHIRYNETNQSRGGYV